MLVTGGVLVVLGYVSTLLGALDYRLFAISTTGFE